MVLYKCDICDKEFKLRGDFKRHKNRKFPCTKTVHSVHKYTHPKSTTEYESDSSSNITRTLINQKVKVCTVHT